MSSKLENSTYHGHVQTPMDAIILFEACRLGLLPRVQQRLSHKERQFIRSGSVFVWDEKETGMRRWTDGKTWSASRVLGSFLTYKEMEDRRGVKQMSNTLDRRANKRPQSRWDGSRHQDMDDTRQCYRNRFKQDGLTKQSFSVMTSTGQRLHLIAYLSRTHPNSGALLQPTTDPQLRSITPAKGMYPDSITHESHLPGMERTLVQASQYMSPWAQKPRQINDLSVQGNAGLPINGYTKDYNWSPSSCSLQPCRDHGAPLICSPCFPSSSLPQLSYYKGHAASEHSSPYQSHPQQSSDPCSHLMPVGYGARRQTPSDCSTRLVSVSSLLQPPSPKRRQGFTIA